MNNRLEIQFVEFNLKSFINAFLKAVEQGRNRIRLRPFNQFASDFLKRAKELDSKAVFYASKEESEPALPEEVQPLTNNDEIDTTLLFANDGKTLSSMLMDYLDIKNMVIIAPITENYCKNRPLFLISIPKAGTHLLYELARSFGYRDGIVCPDNPLPGTWYCIEYSNSHTSAKDFFIDTVRRSPFGNRHHPFSKSPVVFIYRNPLDIVVSEANYYYKDGNTAFYSYLNNKSFEERLLKLIDDPWLLGSIRDRIGNFIAWLDFQNVIPISFEEIIGPNGGGSLEIQTKLIWSLQLKLHVSGNPEQFGDKIFNKDSATFHEGQIGAYSRYFTVKAYETFYALPQDFMVILGYDFEDKNKPGIIPKRADEFRKRSVVYSEADPGNTPIGIEYNFLGCDIVKYKGLYYGIPHNSGVGDLTKEKYSILKKLYSSKDLNSVKQKILLRRGVSRTLLLRGYARKLWRLLSEIIPFHRSLK